MAKKIRQVINNPYALQTHIDKVVRSTQDIVDNTSDNFRNAQNSTVEIPDIYQAFSAMSQRPDEFSLGVAMLNKNMPVVLGRASSVALALEELTPYEVQRKPSDFVENVSTEKVYAELAKKDSAGRNFFDDITAPLSRKTESLAWENMEGYKSHQTTGQAKKALDNIAKNGYVVWDLETTAGNMTGEKNWASHVTEFSFLHVDQQGNKTWHNSIIGASESEYEEYNRLVEKVRSNMRLTDEETVTANRLMRAGHADTKAVVDARGVWNYQSFVGDLETKILDWETMQRGADDMRRIGIAQEEFKKANNLRFTTAESELLDSIRLLTGPNAATAVGFNSRTFDMGRLNQLIASDKFSQAFKDELANIIGKGTNLEFANHLDLLPIYREKVSDDIYSISDYEYMNKHDLTTHQQETLVRKFTSDTGQIGGKDFYEGKAAHLAVTDVGALNALFEKTLLDPNEASKFLYTDTSGERTLESGKQQVLMSKQWFDPKKYELSVAMQDAMTGQLRFGDKMAIDEQGNLVKELFGQSGMQRGVIYKIEDIYSIDNSPYKDTLAQLYPHQNINELAVLKLQVIDLDGEQLKSVRANSPIYYFGNKSNLEQALMDNATYLGRYDAQGKFQLDITEQTRKDLRTFEEAKQGSKSKVQVTRGIDPAQDNELISYISEQGRRRAEEEAGERYTRYHDFTKDNKLIQLMEAIEKQANAKVGTQAFQKKEEEFFHNSVIVSKALMAGNPLEATDPIYQQSFNAYLGYHDKDMNVDGKLFSETATAQRARLQWASNNRNVIKYALSKADAMSGNNINRRTYIYKSIMEGLEDRLRANNTLFSAGGYVPNTMFGYEYQNKFDINLRGFKGIKEDKIMTMSTDGFAGGIANQIIRATQLGQPDKFNASQKVELLKNLQQFLDKHDQLPILSASDVVSSDDTLELASRRFQNSLVRARSKDINAGRLIDPDTHHVRGLSRISMNRINLADQIPDINKEIDAIASQVSQYKTFFNTDLNKIDTRRQRLPISKEARAFAQEAANMLYNSADIDTLDSMNIGYTKKEIGLLRKIQETHRRATTDYLSDLFVHIGSLGGSIKLDHDNKKVIAHAQGQDFELDVPTGEIRGGQYQTRVGQMYVSMPIGIYDINSHYKEGESSQLKHTSLIEKAYMTTRNLMSYHQREALLDGDIVYHIQKMAGEVADTLRESPVVKEFGETQRANQFLYNYQDLMYNIRDVLTRDDLETIKNRTEAIDPKNMTNYRMIQKMMEDPHAINPDHPDMVTLNALFENQDVIFNRFRAKFGDVETNDILDQLNLNIKASSKMRGYLTDFGDWTHAFNQQKRNPASIEDASRINFTDLEQHIANGDEGYEALKGIERGEAFTQEYRDQWMRYSDGLVDESGNALKMHTRVRVNAIHTTQAGLNAIANHGMNELLAMDDATLQGYGLTKEEVAKANDFVRFMFTEEGTNYMHGQALDRLFMERDSTQKVSLENMIMSDGLTIDHLQEKYKAVPKIKIDSNNKIHFEYDGGTFVTTDDVIGMKESMGTKTPIHANYDGVLNFGFFDNEGHLIDQKEVENLLNHNIDVLQDLNSKSATERAQFIMNFMRSRYNASFYVQTTGANPLAKIVEMSEKGMTRALISGTGSINQDIRKVMEELGFQGSLTYGNGKHLEYRDTLDIHTIDSLLNPDFKKSLFYVEAQGRLEKLGRTVDIEDTIINKYKFGSIQNFRSAILKERYSLSNVFDTILRHVKFGDKTILDSADQTWQAITNLEAAQAKHGDISKYRYLINEWIRRGDENYKAGKSQLSGVAWARENIRNYLLPSELKANITDNNIDEYIKINADNNSLVATDKLKIDQLNYSALQQAYKDTGITDQHGKYVGHKTLDFMVGDQQAHVGVEYVQSTLSRSGHYWDRDKVTPNAMRMSTRALTILEGFTYGDQLTENVKGFLAERAKADGQKSDTLFKSIESNIKNGEIILKGAADQIRRNIWNRADGGEEISGFIQKGNDFEWGIDDQKLEKFVKENNIHNGNVKQGKAIMTELLTQLHDTAGITTVNAEGARNLYQSFMTTAAQSFTHGQISLENMKKLGFEVKGIQELKTAGEGADSFMNRNIIVDLALDKRTGHENLLYGGDSRNRYVAMAYNPVAEDSEVKSKVQAKVASIQQGLNDYLTHQQNQNWKYDQAYELAGLQQKVAELPGAIEESFSSKKGVIAEGLRAHMQDAARNTSRGADLLGTEKSKYLNINRLVEQYGSKIGRMEIAGQNLVEEAAKGAHAIQFNYSILSTKRMHDIYDTQIDDITKVLGLDADSFRTDLYDRLGTKGTHGISTREPLQYLGSVQQRQIFFSDIVSGNEAIGNFTGAELRKEDWDSDAVYNAIHKEQVKIEYNGNVIKRNLDQSMIEMLQQKGAKVTYLDTGAAERMASYDTSQVYIGAGEAQRYRHLQDLQKAELSKYGSVIVPDDATDLAEAEKQYGRSMILDVSTGERRLVKVSGYKLGEMEELRKQYAQLEADAYKQDQNYMLLEGTERRNRLLENIGKMTDATAREKALKAVSFSLADGVLAGDLVSRTAQPYGAGMVNHYMQTYLTLASEVLSDKGAQQFLQQADPKKYGDIGVLREDIQLISTAMQEGYLSPKNNLKKIDMEPLRKAYTAAFSISDNASIEERARVQQQLEAVLNDTILGAPNPDDAAKEKYKFGRLDKEVKKIFSPFTYEGDQVKFKLSDDQIVERVKLGISRYADFLVNQVANRGNHYSVMNAASQTSTNFNFGFKVQYAPGSSMPFNQLMNVADKTFQAQGINGALAQRELMTVQQPKQPLSTFPSQGQQSVQARQQQILANQAAQQNASAHTAAKALSREANTLHVKAGGNALFNTGIAIASGLLVAGFANDPSERPKKPLSTAASAAFGNQTIPNSSVPDPALTQAQDGAMISSPTSIPLADSNLNVLRGGPKSSYVINISGNSPRGQQYATDAINSAIQGPIPHNSSINVAITNNYQDTLNQYQVNRMVQTAVGF